MTTLTNSFEGGGTTGTTITTANSGGASGSAFDVVSIGASATATFDNTEIAHGAFAGKITTPATATNSYVEWSTSMGSQAQTWFRMYMYFTANPSSTFRAFTAVQGTTNCASLEVTTGGLLRWIDASNATIITSTATIPLNQWFRVEGYITGSATAGQVEMKLFISVPEGSTPDETDTSAATQNTLGVPNGWRFGVSGSTASITYSMDDIGLSSTGYIGPSAALVLTNSFDGNTGGTSGTAFTSGSGGNTNGGPGNTFFGSLTIGATGTCAYDNAEAHSGSLSAKLASGATAATEFFGWTAPQIPGSPIATRSWIRLYIYITVLPALVYSIAQWKLGGGNCAVIKISPTGQVLIQNAAFSGGVTLAGPVPLNEWVRIEGYVTPGVGGLGQFGVSWYIGDSTTPQQSGSGSNTLAAMVDNILFGQLQSTANNGPYWLDDTGWSTEGPLGPSLFTGHGTAMLALAAAGSGGQALPPVKAAAAPSVVPYGSSLVAVSPFASSVPSVAAQATSTPTVG